MSDFALPAASLAQTQIAPLGVSKTVSGTAGIGQAFALPAIGANAGKIPSKLLPSSVGSEIGYDQITASVSVTSTAEATGTTVITAAAHTFDGKAVIAEFFAPVGLATGAAGKALTVSLFEGSTQIGRLCQIINITANAVAVPMIGKLRFTPSAGSHTYTVTAADSGGGGTISCGSGGTGAYPPAYIRFTEV